MSNSEAKRQIGGMPTGPYRLAGQTFTVTHHKPQEDKFPDLLEGFTLFMPANAPFQELEDAVNRWIKREGR
jgi:hypothetical protein